jgi:hypothetical protein
MGAAVGAVMVSPTGGISELELERWSVGKGLGGVWMRLEASGCDREGQKRVGKGSGSDEEVSGEVGEGGGWLGVIGSEWSPVATKRL